MTPQDAAPPAEGPAHRLSDDLAALLARSAGQGLSTQEILDQMASRGLALLMVLFSAPFLLPISIPGTSTPFGLMLGVLGLTMLLQRPPWVPSFIGRRRVPHASLERVVSILLRAFQRLERHLHPRAGFWVRNAALLRVHGLYIGFMAFVLAIPFPPVPFVASNSIAAWPIFLLGLGLLERDGVFIGLSYAWLILFVAYWALFFLLSASAVTALYDTFPFVQRWMEALSSAS